MSLLTAPSGKNSDISARILIYLSKKRPKANLKVFYYQISSSVKRSEEQLPSNATFINFL